MHSLVCVDVLQVCERVCDVVAWVTEVLGQALNGLGAAHKGLQGKANKGNLHNTQNSTAHRVLDLQ